MRRARRIAAAALVIAFAGIAGPACPSRELVVHVSGDAGVGTLVFACESFRDACATLASCHKNVLLCEQATCSLRQPCEIPGNPEWNPALPMGMALLIVSVDKGEAAIAARSPCVPVNLRPCIKDKTGIIGCPDAPDDVAACAEDVVGRAVTSALGSGLSFDGFTSPDEALLVAGFFRKPGGLPACDDSALVSPDDCSAENLVAAAGFAQPVGGGAFDITCASCQGSTRSSLGRDTGACPVAKGECFAKRVADALAATKKK